MPIIIYKYSLIHSIDIDDSNNVSLVLNSENWAVEEVYNYEECYRIVIDKDWNLFSLMEYLDKAIDLVSNVYADGKMTKNKKN